MKATVSPQQRELSSIEKSEILRKMEGINFVKLRTQLSTQKRNQWISLKAIQFTYSAQITEKSTGKLNAT